MTTLSIASHPIEYVHSAAYIEPHYSLSIDKNCPAQQVWYCNKSSESSDLIIANNKIAWVKDHVSLWGSAVVNNLLVGSVLLDDDGYIDYGHMTEYMGYIDLDASKWEFVVLHTLDTYDVTHTYVTKSDPNIVRFEWETGILEFNTITREWGLAQ